MTHDKFDLLQERLLNQVVGMNQTKGREYAHSDDRLANFKRTGEMTGVKPLRVCWVFTQKHLDGIASYVKEEKEFSEEKIEGRIVDAITYLTLLYGLIMEEKDEPQGRTKADMLEYISQLGTVELSKIPLGREFSSHETHDFLERLLTDAMVVFGPK